MNEGWAEWIVLFCLAAADSGAPRTVYNSRIDGLILPACEPFLSGFFGQCRGKK